MFRLNKIGEVIAMHCEPESCRATKLVSLFQNWDFILKFRIRSDSELLKLSKILHQEYHF